MRFQIGHADGKTMFVLRLCHLILNRGVKETGNLIKSLVLRNKIFHFLRIPANIKDAAFCVGVKNGDSEVWNTILQVYVNSKSMSERQSAQWALACSTDRIQLSK